MTDTTVKLASCTLNESKGLTDDLASKMGHKLGSTHIAIVEFRVAKHIDDLDADPTVHLKVLEVEFAQGTDAERHLQELKRSIYLTRRPEQPQLDSMDDLEDDEAEVIRRGQALISCSHCLHGKTNELIDHAPEDADGDWCEWKECGHPVTAGTEICQHPEHDPNAGVHSDTPEALEDPEGLPVDPTEPVHA